MTDDDTRDSRMNTKSMQDNWDAWGREDPLWAITTFDDKRGNRWNLDEFMQTGERDVTALMAFIDTLGLDLERGRALDFGCGVGRLTQPLSRHFERVVGVDVAPSMIETARKNNKRGERCAFHVNDTVDLQQFPDRHFDFVVTKAVLQHIRPPATISYIKEFSRVLAPKGLLVFQLHSELENPSVKQHLMSMLPPRLVYAFRDLKRRVTNKPTIEMYGIPRNHVLQLLEDRGMTIVDVAPDPQLSGAWVTYQYCAVKR